MRGDPDQLSADTNDRSIAAYVQDSWQVRPNLTINAGLRWEQQVGYVAKFLQGTIAPDTDEKIPDVAFQLDNLIAPRLGFIFDPTQEGKSKIFGHWGRFYENIPMDMNVRSFGGETHAAGGRRHRSDDRRSQQQLPIRPRYPRPHQQGAGVHAWLGEARSAERSATSRRAPRASTRRSSSSALSTRSCPT